MLLKTAVCSSDFVKVASLERKLSMSYKVNLLFDALVTASVSSKNVVIVSATSPKIGLRSDLNIRIYEKNELYFLIKNIIHYF